MSKPSKDPGYIKMNMHDSRIQKMRLLALVKKLFNGRAIDLLLHVYKKEFKKMGGYLVDAQKIKDKKDACIKLKRVERFVVSIGEYEEEIFKKRSEIRDRKMKRILEDFHAEANEDESNPAVVLDGPVEAKFAANKEKETDLVHLLSLSTQKIQLDDFVEMTADSSKYTAQVLRNTLELKQKLKKCLRNQSDTFRDGVFGSDKVKLVFLAGGKGTIKLNFQLTEKKKLRAYEK